MTKDTSRLSAKVSATFLLLLGLAILGAQLATWSGKGILFPWISIFILTLGIVPIAVAVYTMGNFPARAVVLKCVMGIVTLASILTIMLVLFLNGLAPSNDGFLKNLDINIYLLPPIICIALFIWLMVDKPKKV